ncbi:MAG: zinc ribbon domain-containing protein [bacterium]|nr:zinc ribbon domain-containing protein [bacterium]
MAASDSSLHQRAGHVKDARGRSVTTLDPITMNLLRQTDVIPVETLRRLADEIGVGWSRRIRTLFIIAVVCMGLFLLVTVLGVIADAIRGAGLHVPLPMLVLLPSVWIGPWAIWMGTRAARLKRIRRMMLAHLRCPHCGYDIRGLPTDPQDGATVCPECGCAWRLEGKAK